MDGKLFDVKAGFVANFYGSVSLHLLPSRWGGKKSCGSFPGRNKRGTKCPIICTGDSEPQGKARNS